MTNILVPTELVKMCEEFATIISKHFYRNNQKKRNNRLYSKGATDEQKVYDLFLFGTTAEVALYIYLGEDPAQIFLRPVGVSDGDFDLKINGKTIDMKASDHPGASRLMWPVRKLDRLPQAADILVMAKVLKSKATVEGQVVELCGWVTKQDFISQHWKAKGITGVIDGTPFMNQKSLYSMEQLVQHLGHVKATGESHG